MFADTTKEKDGKKVTCPREEEEDTCRKPSHCLADLQHLNGLRCMYVPFFSFLNVSVIILACHIFVFIEYMFGGRRFGF